MKRPCRDLSCPPFWLRHPACLDGPTALLRLATPAAREHNRAGELGERLSVPHIPFLWQRDSSTRGSSSADQRASVNCGGIPGPTYLADTTQVNWHSTFADSTSVGGNTDHNIGYYTNIEDDMVDNGNLLESSSTLGTGSDGGSTFTNTYDNNHGTYCG